MSYFIAAKLANHRLVMELNHLSRYDALTGLRNRNALSMAVDALMQHPSCVGIVYADVNGLKEINDTRGHQAGDEALKRAATCSRSATAVRMPTAWAVTSSSC